MHIYSVYHVLGTVLDLERIGKQNRFFLNALKGLIVLTRIEKVNTKHAK